jgi:hypothetical protein
MKATSAKTAKHLKDIPNIGPAMIRDFKMLEIYSPEDLRLCDPFELYKRLCEITSKRHDPCVLDTFMAAVDFMNGAVPQPWWLYTKTRKQRYPKV